MRAKKDDIKKHVRDRYARAVKTKTSCCGSASSPCCGGQAGPDLGEMSQKVGYSPDELAAIPEDANLGLGCGNPTAIAGLKPGETVLDLGSGAGIDCFLAAAKVGPKGRVIGVDMTPDMIDKARQNARQAGAKNVEFRLGEIENLPAADSSVDVIISNCVINLSADKSAVLAEAFRVLRPGGRLAVTDIVVQGAPLTAEARSALSLWAECVTGALTAAEYTALLSSAGFGAVSLETIKVYGADDLPRGEGATPTMDLVGPETQITSAFVRALKPAR